MSSKAIHSIDHAESSITKAVIRLACKLTALLCACQAKHCHNLIADIHEAVRYSESQGVRSNATKQATAKRIAKLEADAARWAARQQALLV